jgi:hypothetical protein
LSIVILLLLLLLLLTGHLGLIRPIKCIANPSFSMD